MKNTTTAPNHKKVRPGLTAAQHLAIGWFMSRYPVRVRNFSTALDAVEKRPMSRWYYPCAMFDHLDGRTLAEAIDGLAEAIQRLLDEQASVQQAAA